MKRRRFLQGIGGSIAAEQNPMKAYRALFSAATTVVPNPSALLRKSANVPMPSYYHDPSHNTDKDSKEILQQVDKMFVRFQYENSP